MHFQRQAGEGAEAANRYPTVFIAPLAIDRFLRPLCYQNYPDGLLPDARKNAIQPGIQRLVDTRGVIC
ncbi:hypothetical protein [Pseudomonas sp. BN515]|uniref:hypothetical protein n=1 Tax=Pseudomonas sp. BN515 TaxID=2567892 RepID=UPI0024551E06|nr:hypothetical protein [Pseudomonas sp. BN515]MDH4872187.1 hypothetical protein [Pseudomonas sp. BN515]